MSAQPNPGSPEAVAAGCIRALADLVRCSHCQGTYHLGAGRRIARYADCDVFEAPCCGRTVDTRSWKSFPDYHDVRDDFGYRPRDAKGRYRKIDLFGRFP